MRNSMNPMIAIGHKSRALKRLLALSISGAFLLNALFCAEAHSLATEAGNRETYAKLRAMMKSRLSTGARHEVGYKSTFNREDKVRHGQAVMNFLASRASYDAQTGEWTPIDGPDGLVQSGPYDIVMVFGSGDLRVPGEGAEIIKLLREANPGMIVVTSGKYGGAQQADALNVLDENGERITEARRFREILEESEAWNNETDMMETESTNTGENIRFTRRLLYNKGLTPKRILVLQLPEAQLRAGLSLIKQYPDTAAGETLSSMGVEKVANYSPHVRDISKMSEEELKKQINAMLQELQCLRGYPDKGFMVPVPDHMYNAIAEAEKYFRVWQFSDALSGRAELFKRHLIEMLLDGSGDKVFIGIESDIGRSQLAQIMPLRKAVDEIRQMKDPRGHPLFPNLIIRRGKAFHLLSEVKRLAGADKYPLKLERTFIASRNTGDDSGPFSEIKGAAWVSVIDDAAPDRYLPIFEAITINIMAYLDKGIADIKGLYDAISDRPISEEDLREGIGNKMIFIMPKAAQFDHEQLREVYELARQAFTAA